MHRLMPKVEKDMQPDQKIASMFEWNQIKDNKNLPYPYVVSFSSRPDNEYMWDEYAQKDGVVMEIDNTKNVIVPDIPILRLASCVYADSDSEDKLIEMLRQEYNEVGKRFIRGPQKEMALTILNNDPQQFVKFIAVGMLFMTAPRIKKAADYWMEEETRAIIPLPIPDYNILIEGKEDIVTKFGLNPIMLRTIVANEKFRRRIDGTTVFYREMHLPIHLLKAVYVKSSETKAAVESFISNKGLAVLVKLI